MYRRKLDGLRLIHRHAITNTAVRNKSTAMDGGAL